MTLIIVFFVSITLSSFFLFSNPTPEITQKTIIDLGFKNCNAQGKQCDIETSEFRLNISFDKNIYYLKPFNISMLNENKGSLKTNSIFINFKMNNMNMGVNRFKLNKKSLKNNKRLWNGMIVLPICVTGLANWIAEIEIIRKEKIYTFKLPIQVKK